MQDPNTESGRECMDQQDNDGDGKADCEDTDCSTGRMAQICEAMKANGGTSAWTPTPEDPNTESGRECRDQQDNDGDGTMDCEDPDCARSPLCRGAQNGVDCTIRAFAAATSASCPAAPQGKRVPDSCPEACAAVITPWATACTGSEGYTQANAALGGGLDVFAGKCAGGH